MDSTEEFNQTVISSLEKLLVPALKDGFESPMKRSDFDNYINDGYNLFPAAAELVSKVTPDETNHKYKWKLLSISIIVHGQHSSPQLWTSKTFCELSSRILHQILSLFNYSSVCNALVENRGALFKDILVKMRPWLLKNSWKNFPAAVMCYSWLLLKIQSPDLSEHFSTVLPTALIITDDFEIEYKIIGLKCLTHILCNVPMTQLSWHGHDEVILKTIEPLAFSKESELIKPFTSTMVSLMNKKFPLKNNPILHLTEFDEMISRLLKNMLLEEKIDLRLSYVEALGLVIGARGLGIVLHSNLLLKVLEEYLLEPTSSFQSLKVLLSYMETIWPRIQKHSIIILVVLVKIYLGLEKKRFPEECKDMVYTNLTFLYKLCPEETDALFDKISVKKNLTFLKDHLLTRIKNPCR